MDQVSLLKPALYRAEGNAVVRDRPALLGGECACGYVFFPLQPYGCEKCGGLEFKEVALSGAGTLLASVRVHLHAGKSRQAPFTVGAIALDDGPIVRALIEGGKDDPRPGDRMATMLVAVTDAEGAMRFDLRFTQETGA